MRGEGPLWEIIVAVAVILAVMILRIVIIESTGQAFQSVRSVVLQCRRIDRTFGRTQRPKW